MAGQLLVFMHTSPFRRGERQYSRSITVPLRRPTFDSAPLVAAAVRALEAIYRPGYRLAKAGVLLLDLQDGSVEQHELDLDDDETGCARLMDAIDRINDRFGRGTLSLASEGLGGQNWR